MHKNNIGIVTEDFEGWNGGIDFLVDLASIILFKDKYNVEFFIPKKTPTLLLKDSIYNKKSNNNYKKIENIIRNAFPDCRIIKYNKGILVNHSGKHLARKLIRRKIDIVLPIKHLYNSVLLKKIKTVVYIPDLQHKHLAEYFSMKECIIRDDMFQKLIDAYNYVVVQSIDTKKDICNFYNIDSNRIVIMYDYPRRYDNELIDIDEVKSKYNITKKYFMICNQFWQHKSLETVIDAAVILKEEFDFEIVFTGETSDYRNPDYYDSLIDRIKENKVESNIKILGLIPKNEQMTLLKNSIALIQPTLFEGNPGGGSVVDAESLGVNCIVSDIPINKEINQVYSVDFFKNRDSQDLADKMRKLLTSKQNIQGKELDYEKFWYEYDKTISNLLYGIENE